MTETKRVVVIGGGFAGLWAVRKLAAAPVAITLIDRHNHHLFQPLLYQVATAGLAAPSIAAPLRHILRDQRNVTVLMGEVLGIDTASRHVTLPRPADPVRLSSRCERRDARLLRTRSVGAIRAGPQDARRRFRDPSPGARRLRGGGSRHQRGRARRVPHLRRHRRRSDGRGAGGNAGRDRAAHPDARFPSHRHAQGTHHAHRSRSSRALHIRTAGSPTRHAGSSSGWASRCIPACR